MEKAWEGLSKGVELLRTNKQHLQDKNAGNLGDYLKHFWLVKLIESLLKKHPASSIAYIESHAGAGLYALLDTHWKHRDDYRKLVCSDPTQWNTFDRINLFIKHRVYFGSFILAGRLLSEGKNRKVKMVLYEKDRDVIERIEYFRPSLLPLCQPKICKRLSTPEIIKNRIKECQGRFDIIVCFVDPYFKNGEEDKIWCETLTWDISNCYILLFRPATGQGKDENYKIKFAWDCLNKEPIKSAEKGIKGYAMFGNTLSEEYLKKHR